MAAPMPLTTSCLALINFITLLLSIPILVVGIWLASRHDSDCLSFLQWPILVIGIVMFVTSLLGLLGTLRRVVTLLWMYLAVLLLIILLLFSFMVFTFVVTEGGSGERVAGARFKEYHVNEFSSWLRNRVSNPGRWERIKHCVRDSLVCTNLDMDYPVISDFYGAELSGVQTGCCKPPSGCGYKFISPTTWIAPTISDADKDCQRWSNNVNQLCYECDSCRAGVMKEVQKDWRRIGKVSITVLVLLIIVYVMACVAFWNAVRDNLFGSANFLSRNLIG